jgi:deazaflavin-dependent oxidoreductase (nitroreductase family)
MLGRAALPWRSMARFPTLLYRAGFGWLLGQRFLLIHHVGRHTGRSYSTLVEVVARDEATNSYYVAAAFGERTDWYCNLLARPRTQIEVGRQRWQAVAERLPPYEAERVFAAYARRHKPAFHFLFLGRLFGLRRGSAGEFARRFPLIRLRTTEPIAREPGALTAAQFLVRSATLTGVAATGAAFTASSMSFSPSAVAMRMNSGGTSTPISRQFWLQ